MTVNEAIEVLIKIRNSGEGDLPLQTMSVERGIPIANDIAIKRAETYDGERVWVYGVERHLPEWIPNVRSEGDARLLAQLPSTDGLGLDGQERKEK